MMSTTNSKWLPPQQEGFGPWIEHEGDRRPPALKDGYRIHWLTRLEREQQCFPPVPESMQRNWQNWQAPRAWHTIAAYCVKLDEPQVQRPAEPQQPAASGLTRLVPLREKTLHALEETTIRDPQVVCWGVSIDGVPMIRLDTLASAQQVQRLADAAFQAGRQKAFSDLLGFVEGQR